MNKKKTDFIIVFGLAIFALVFSLIFKVSFITSTILFFYLPGAWLSFKNSQNILKSLIFTAILAIPMTIIVDYILVTSGGWLILDSIFKNRLYNVIAWEQFIWAFGWVYLVVMFYDYFFDRKKLNLFHIVKINREKLINKKLKYLSFYLIAGVLILLNFIVINPNYLNLPYPYLTVFTLLGLLPLFILLINFPNLIYKFLKASIYFIFLAILIEYVGLTLGYWTFPSNKFIGFLTLGNINIPYDEIIYYFIFSTGMILTYYEFFNDDKK